MKKKIRSEYCKSLERDKPALVRYDRDRLRFMVENVVSLLPAGENAIGDIVHSLNKFHQVKEKNRTPFILNLPESESDQIQKKRVFLLNWVSISLTMSLVESLQCLERTS